MSELGHSTNLTLIIYILRRAMCESKDQTILDEASQIALKGARDQDVMYFFAGLSKNKLTKRTVTKLFENNYDEVRTSSKRRSCRDLVDLVPLYSSLNALEVPSR